MCVETLQSLESRANLRKPHPEGLELPTSALRARTAEDLCPLQATSGDPCPLPERERSRKDAESMKGPKPCRSRTPTCLRGAASMIGGVVTAWVL